MKYLVGQLFSLLGAGLAAACCLGIPIIIVAFSAIGLGFLIHDAILVPLFIGFIALTLFLLYRAGRQYHLIKIFYLGVTGGLLSIIGLILLMYGITPIAWLIYLGLFVLLVSCFWNTVMQWKIHRKKSIKLLSTIKCPKCGFEQEETMPTDSCLYFYQCKKCKKTLKPLSGDCCVFCSYGSIKCPSKQSQEVICNC